MSAISIDKEIAGVVADAEMRFSPQGKAVTKVRLAFSDSFVDEQTGKWDSANQFFVEATAWEKTAEQLVEVATQGTQILVWGKLVTDQWTDNQTGEKRSKTALKLKGFRPLGKLPESGGSTSAQSTTSGGFGGASDPSANQPQPSPATSGWGGQLSSGDSWGGWQ